MTPKNIVCCSTWVAVAALAGACDAGPTPESAAATAMTEAEAAAVKGGVSVDIVYPFHDNHSEPYDNIRFHAEVESGFTSDPTYVSLWADSTKIASETMQFVGGETKLWNERHAWPLNGYRDAQFKYYLDGQYYEAAGDSSRTNVRVHPDTHVHGIHFWNLSHKGVSSNVSSAFTAARVDATSIGRSLTNSNIDGVFAQCPTKVQFRGSGTSSLQLTHDPGPGLNCMDLNAVRQEHCPTITFCDDDDPENPYALEDCQAVVDCLWGYVLAADTFDMSRGYTSAHIFHVQSTPCADPARNVWFNTTLGSRSLALIAALNTPADAQHYTTVLAHELMHDTGAGHCNDPPGLSNPGCEPEDCNTNISFSRNLMCSSGNGRDLSPVQCDRIEDFRWTNRN